MVFKRCIKYYLGREQSFDKGFRVQFSIFSVKSFGNWQPFVAYKSVACKKKRVKMSIIFLVYPLDINEVLRTQVPQRLRILPAVLGEVIMHFGK